MAYIRPVGSFSLLFFFKEEKKRRAWETPPTTPFGFFLLFLIHSSAVAQRFFLVCVCLCVCVCLFACEWLMGVGRRPAKQVFKPLITRMLASSCCCCCSFWLRMLKLLMPGPPHTARGYCFSLSLFCARLACGLFLDFYLSVFFWLPIRLILIHFWSVPGYWLIFFLFSLSFQKTKQNTNSAIFPVCVLVLVLFFLPGGVCYSFFNLIFSPPLSVCVAYSSYFLFFILFSSAGWVSLFLSGCVLDLMAIRLWGGGGGWRRFGVYRRLLPETGVFAFRLAITAPLQSCPTSAVSRLKKEQQQHICVCVCVCVACAW